MVIWEGQVILYLEEKESAFLASPGEMRKAVQCLWVGRMEQGAMTDHAPLKGSLIVCTCLETPSAGLILRQQ